MQEQVVGSASSPMLLGRTGLTTPVLEASIGTALRVRVLRRDCVSVDQFPDADTR